MAYIAIDVAIVSVRVLSVWSSVDITCCRNRPKHYKQLPINSIKSVLFITYIVIGLLPAVLQFHVKRAREMVSTGDKSRGCEWRSAFRILTAPDGPCCQHVRPRRPYSKRLVYSMCKLLPFVPLSPERMQLGIEAGSYRNDLFRISTSASLQQVLQRGSSLCMMKALASGFET